MWGKLTKPLLLNLFVDGYLNILHVLLRKTHFFALCFSRKYLL